MTANGEFEEGNGTGVVILGANGATIGGNTPAGRNLISGNGVGIGIANVTSAQVEGNYIGLDVAGTSENGGNEGAGIEIINADNVTIGGNDISQRNIISGNGGDGILIEGNNTTALSGDAIINNYIGTDVTGSIDEGNTENGIEIVGGGQSDSPATNVTIGSVPNSQEILNEDSRNVISANQGAGIYIHGSGASGNTILRNYIGIGADGETPLGNQIGISIDTAAGNAAVAALDAVAAAETSLQSQITLP